MKYKIPLDDKNALVVTLKVMRLKNGVEYNGEEVSVFISNGDTLKGRLRKLALKAVQILSEKDLEKL